MVTIDPPWRLDPLQTIVDVSWAGSKVFIATGTPAYTGFDSDNSVHNAGRIYTSEDGGDNWLIKFRKQEALFCSCYDKEHRKFFVGGSRAFGSDVPSLKSFARAYSSTDGNNWTELVLGIEDQLGEVLLLEYDQYSKTVYLYSRSVPVGGFDQTYRWTKSTDGGATWTTYHDHVVLFADPIYEAIPAVGLFDDADISLRGSLLISGVSTRVHVRSSYKDMDVSLGSFVANPGTRSSIIQVSYDDKVSWRDSSIAEDVRGFSIGSKKIVVAARTGGPFPGSTGPYAGSLYTSSDGLSWSATKGPTDNLVISDVAFARGKFAAVGGNLTSRIIHQSDDGLSWRVCCSTAKNTDYSGSNPLNQNLSSISAGL